MLMDLWTWVTDGFAAGSRPPQHQPSTAINIFQIATEPPTPSSAPPDSVFIYGALRSTKATYCPTRRLRALYQDIWRRRPRRSPSPAFIISTSSYRILSSLL